MRRFLLAAAFLALPGLALADEVQLKNGAAFQGRVTEQGDRVLVEVDFGTMSFPKSDVKAITRESGPLHTLDEKMKTVRDADSAWTAGQWAEQNGLPGRAKELYRKVLEYNPDHEEARKALGYTRYEDKWMTEDEVMAAQGFVRYRGRWMSPTQREALQREELEVRLAAIREEALQNAVRRERDRIAAERRAAGNNQNPIPPGGRPHGLPLSGVPFGLPLTPSPLTPPEPPPYYTAD